MDLISIKRAAELAGLAPNTLRIQARAGRLRTVKPAHDLLTTRMWLHEYLRGREGRQGGHRPLPPDYVTPAGMDPIVPVPARRPATSRRTYRAPGRAAGDRPLPPDYVAPE
jgi:hypothetical protein